jgi:hypothetical protein
MDNGLSPTTEVLMMEVEELLDDPKLTDEGVGDEIVPDDVMNGSKSGGGGLTGAEGKQLGHLIGAAKGAEATVKGTSNLKSELYIKSIRANTVCALSIEAA